MRVPLLLCCLTLISACGVGGPGSSTPAAPEPVAAFEGPVPRASCGEGDLVETGLQGQVSGADRASARSLQGYTCNLERVGHYDNDGEGAGWQHAWYEDCSYMGTASSATGGDGETTRPQQFNKGVAVLDVSDSTSPTRTATLTTISMLDPWESLKVNEKRGLLGANNGKANTQGGPEIDLYDIKEDCRQPRLLFSGPIAGAPNGHAGRFTHDGLTYWGGTGGSQPAWATDVSDPSNPVLIAGQDKMLGLGSHDPSLNEDGTRAYFPNQVQGKGLAIVDVSQIQNRVPDPQVTLVSELYWTDGDWAQMVQPITIKGRKYLLFVDENGKGAARLIDVEDETNPFIVSKLKLDVHMPENADATPEGNSLFSYQGHYCTASDGINNTGTDTIHDAAIVACGYFESGVRVFDIRDPQRPREIAYYNPPASPGPKAGSYYLLTGDCNAADWSSSYPRFRLDRNEIWFTSQCSGFQVLRFTKPLAELLGPAPTS